MEQQRSFGAFYKSEEYQNFWCHRNSVLIYYTKLSPNQGGIHLRGKTIKTGGGITVYVKEGITYLHLNDLECNEIEAIWCGILIERGNSFLIGIMYCPLNTSKHLQKFTNMLLTEATNLLNNMSLLNKETMILGDLKCNYLDNKNNVLIHDLFKLCSCEKIIETATRITKDSNSY